jgi:hypothetical protein
VGKGGVLDVNYVGKLGRKETVPVDLNPAIYDCSGAYFQAILRSTATPPRTRAALTPTASATGHSTTAARAWKIL